MNARKTLFQLILLTLLPLSVQAQTAREEIRANKYLSGSNYLDYDRQQATRPLTAAPKGYEPFYMSHYGRHGSRWLIGENSYTSVIEPFRKAHAAGKLTARGEETLRQLEAFLPTTVKRLGDLTTVGERQHHGIGRRMVRNFPEIFKTRNVPIDARSTTVVRCILSMEAECEELTAANPTARVHNDVSESLQYYLNQPRTGLVERMYKKGREIRHELRREAMKDIPTGRLMQLLFNDQRWVTDSLRPEGLMYGLFEVAANMQSHDGAPDFYQLFTDDEIFSQWTIRNKWWYVDYGASPLTGGVMPFSQRNLLRNIIETADTVTRTQATLRFGHEVCVMPLACLLELDSCGIVVDDLNQLDRHWRNYRIFPMACNIQLVFYRPKKGAQGDILVKALLNEREVSLPVKAVQYPYYRWADLRQCYLDKLNRFDEQERQMPDEKPAAPKEYAQYYQKLPVEVAPVSKPVIPQRSVNLRDFGAKGDGLTLCTEAFQKAIAHLSQRGGGRLVVPMGIWLTGPIRLESNIELHLERNAVVYLSPDKRLFLNPDAPKGKCFSGIRAEHCHDIAITGEGIIDGNGSEWYYVKRAKLSDVEWRQRTDRGGTTADKGSRWYPFNLKHGYPNVAASAEKQEKMRADLIRLTDCERVLLQDVTVQNSPRFHIHPFYCTDLIIDGVSVRCPWNAQNGDGIDITDCHRVLLVRSKVDVGDDGLCFKSDPPQTGRISGNEDIIVEDNLVRHAHGGFVLGSNTASGMRRFVVRRNTFAETDTGLRFKSGIGRGGKTEQLYISDIMMTDIANEAIVFQCDYDGKSPDETEDLYKQKDYLKRFTPAELAWTPDFQDIHIKDITCRGTKTAIKAAGLAGLDCVHDIDISNSVFIYNKVGADIDEPTTRITLNNVQLVENRAPKSGL